MAFDRGEDKRSPSAVVDDRSEEYKKKLRDDVCFLKQNINDINLELSDLKEKRDRVLADYNALMADKEAALSIALKKVKDAEELVVSLMAEEKSILARRRYDVEDFDKKMALYVEKKNARIYALNSDIRNAEVSLKKIVNNIEARTSELDSLEKECDSLKALNASLASLNTDLDGKVKEQEIAIAEAKKFVPVIESAIANKKAEVASLSATAEARAEDLNRIQNQLKDLQKEKDLVAIEREKNTKRAKELSIMANELKVESQALANKNAILNKREATLREAQAKI